MPCPQSISLCFVCLLCRHARNLIHCGDIVRIFWQQDTVHLIHPRQATFQKNYPLLFRLERKNPLILAKTFFFFFFSHTPNAANGKLFFLNLKKSRTKNCIEVNDGVFSKSLIQVQFINLRSTVCILSLTRLFWNFWWLFWPF